jgi:hypothetical protein
VLSIVVHAEACRGDGDGCANTRARGNPFGGGLGVLENMLDEVLGDVVHGR